MNDRADHVPAIERVLPVRFSLSLRSAFAAAAGVFHRLLLGDGEKQAAALGLSGHTVHSYAQNIYHHFKVSGRAALMAMVLRTVLSGPKRAVPARHRHVVRLTDSERAELVQLVADLSDHSDRRAIHARVLLACDDGNSDGDVAGAVGVSSRMVDRIRQRFVSSDELKGT